MSEHHDVLRPVYLIAGSDRPKVRRAVERLRRRVTAESGSDLDTLVFDAEAVTPEAVVRAANTPGLTLGTRLIIVTSGQAWKAKQRQVILAYLKDPMPDTCLAIEADSAGAASDALRKAVHKGGGLIEFDLPKRHELSGWVLKLAHAKGIRIKGPTARHLVAVVGEEPERVERELEKLGLYASGHEATDADVDAVCSPGAETRIFELMEAVALREEAHAFAVLEKLYASADPDDDANRVFYQLLRHVQLLDRAAQLGEVDQATVSRQLGVQGYRARKLMEQRRHYDRRRFDRAYRAFAEAEAGLRGRAPATLESESGVNHSDRLVMELALARLLR